MNEPTGLRAQKRIETIWALCRAALTLATELGGPESVSVDAIAERAHVSRRTFFNYFPTKDVAFVWPLVSHVHNYLDAMQRRPIDEPLWDVLQNAAIAALNNPETDLTLVEQAERVLAFSPLLFAQLRRDITTGEPMEDAWLQTASEIARRTPSAPETEMYRHLMTECAGMGLRIASRIAAQRGGDPVVVVNEVFTLLRSGIPQPLDPETTVENSGPDPRR